jgi:hypothetical protein
VSCENLRLADEIEKLKDVQELLASLGIRLHLWPAPVEQLKDRLRGVDKRTLRHLEAAQQALAAAMEMIRAQPDGASAGSEMTREEE